MGDGEYRITESMPPRHHEYIHAMGFACLNRGLNALQSHKHDTENLDVRERKE